jgi:hypothetical protein
MLVCRFIPMVAILALAGALVQKKKVPESAGTLPTDSPLFVGFLVGVVIIVAGLTFFPALALGPIASTSWCTRRAVVARRSRSQWRTEHRSDRESAKTRTAIWNWPIIRQAAIDSFK